MSDNAKECYCVECGTKLKPLKITNDWDERKLHKKCWKLRHDMIELHKRVDMKYTVKDKYDWFTGLKLVVSIVT